MDQDSATTILTVEALKHRFGDRQVLDGLSFQVKAGEVVGILGPNGSGKSTALKVICGLALRQEGTIQYEGRALSHPDHDVRRRLGVVFQSPSLDLKLSATENLALTAAMHGLASQDAKKRIEQTLETCGLTQRRNDLVGTFSGGMRRRLDLGRALLHKPSLLVMDEPTNGLDERAFRDTWEVLDRLRSRDGAAVLIATHRPEEAAKCDTLIVLEKGQAACMASPESLVNQVAPDVLTIVCTEPQTVAQKIKDSLGLEAIVAADGVQVPCEEGHQKVVRIVELFKERQIDSISLRRPTLADVFLKITGTHLDEEATV